MNVDLDIDVRVSVTENEEERDSFTLASATQAVCEVFGVCKADLISPLRAGFIIRPRFALMYLGYYLTHHSTTTVGKFLERDHTTIIHGLRRAIALKRSDKDFESKLFQARDRAFDIEGDRRRKINEIKREVKRVLEGTGETVAREGFIVGDKVVFDEQHTEG